MEYEGTAKPAVGPVLESTPTAHLGTVDDIGQLAVFLTSLLASFVTGAVVVDCGRYLGGSSLLNLRPRICRWRRACVVNAAHA